MTKDVRFDFIVVGAGPAGCVLANRLTEDSSTSVLLLEAGPDYGADPAAWPADLRDSTSFSSGSHPWGYRHTGRPDDRPLPLDRARVVGGCSTINACFWLRGPAADYDGWAALGNPGWGFADLLPYFRRSEADPIGSPLHGIDGPVPVSRVTEAELGPLDRALTETAASLGMPWTADANGEVRQRPGVRPMPKNVADGVRMHGAFTYLAPARARPNLLLLPNVTVDRVLIENARAIGIETAAGRILLGGAVVLCAGSYGSPAILLRSGIEPVADLRNLGIQVVTDLPGVGQNLLDHPFLPFYQTGAVWPVRPQAVLESNPLFPLLLRARSRRVMDEIDLHLYPGQFFDTDRDEWAWGVSVSLMDARSRGTVRLASPDPAEPPVIDHAYFHEEGDLDALCDGFALALRLAESDPLAGLLESGGEFKPSWYDADGMRAWVQERASTTWHPQSTCRMGPATDAGAVVDHLGRVHGLRGLRVADASVFPGAIRANIHCSVVAVAEKLADTIKSGAVA